ncbi:MAG TPA: hypothetical protein VG917_05545 [Patescibacteria group bacterium]|nr:hypothetical protein [Patescibacteria group bacterium]
MVSELARSRDEYQNASVQGFIKELGRGLSFEDSYVVGKSAAKLFWIIKRTVAYSAATMYETKGAFCDALTIYFQKVDEAAVSTDTDIAGSISELANVGLKRKITPVFLGEPIDMEKDLKERYGEKVRSTKVWQFSRMI